MSGLHSLRHLLADWLVAVLMVCRLVSPLAHHNLRIPRMPELLTTLPSTTTSEQDRVTAGQRRTNILWEATQAVIAICVIGTTLFVDGRVALMAVELGATQQGSLMQLNVLAALVTGFYFGRTNHSRIGGVGGDLTVGGR